jgi:hypothetical protein
MITFQAANGTLIKGDSIEIKNYTYKDLRGTANLIVTSPPQPGFADICFICLVRKCYQYA